MHVCRVFVCVCVFFCYFLTNYRGQKKMVVSLLSLRNCNYS